MFWAVAMQSSPFSLTRLSGRRLLSHVTVFGWPWVSFWQIAASSERRRIRKIVKKTKKGEMMKRMIRSVLRNSTQGLATSWNPIRDGSEIFENERVDLVYAKPHLWLSNQFRNRIARLRLVITIHFKIASVLSQISSGCFTHWFLRLVMGH